VQEALDKAGSAAGAARLLGVGKNVVHLRIQEWGMTLPGLAAKPGAQWNPPGPATELSDAEREAAALKYLQAKGYMLDRHVACDNRRFNVQTKNFAGGRFSVGVVTDTHLGSRFQQLTLLNAAYDYFAENGIDTVLHVGDVGAGNGSMYRGQVYEIFVQSADDRFDYIHKNYPRRDGMKTLMVSGNHDHSDLKKQGQNLIDAVCKAREDLVYLGMSGAYVTIHDVPFYLLHSCGGVAYARSYRMQKLIEQISPENKPKVMLFGHWHTTCELPMYRNVYGWMAGCFESQTPYELEKGLYPELGFTVLEVTANAGDVIAVRKEWFPFFEPLAEDY
jgi:predicted phosphodiesterase